MAPALSALIEMLWRKFRDAGGACVVDVTGVGRRPGRERGAANDEASLVALGQEAHDSVGGVGCGGMTPSAVRDG